MELKWTPALSIGHDMIDSQHIELFSLFDKFIEGCAKGEGKPTLLKLHASLKEYTNTHFRAEEALMQGSNYPGLARHQREHQKFQKDISEISGQISDQGPTLISLVQTNKALVSWLVNHVQETDQKFGRFLNEG